MRIMLLTDIPPCENFTAGIVLNIICDFLIDEGHTVCCYAVKHPDVNAIIPPDKQEKMKFKVIKKPRENWGHYNNIASCVGNNFIAMFTLPKIAKDIAEFAKENNSELIWSVVQGQTMIKLTRPVSKASKIPYVLQVWDPPIWWLRENKFDNFTLNSVLKEFGRAIRDSKCLIAASWAMAKEYQDLYGCERSIPVILGFDESPIIPKGEKREDCFVISMSGQMYAKWELYSLIDALGMMNWTHNGKKIILRLYGRYFEFPASVPTNIEFRGWLQQSELLPELADADLLYCPYWFAPEFEQPARLSFPSKLSTYLKTGVPVLFHGPGYSSPGVFIKENQAGYVCETNDPNDISIWIQNIINDPGKAQYAENALEAFKKYLSLDRMKENFFEALRFNCLT